VNEKLSLIASVSVIGLVAYGAYLLSDIDKAEVAKLNATVKTINDTLHTETTAASPDKTKVVLYSGIAILLVATTYVLLKGKK
jgi:hypothetical protein